MRIAIGSDHAGYELKRTLLAHLRSAGHDLLDKGTDSMESTDYPTYAHRVAADVANGTAVLGLVICGSGNGVNITANKHKGIRSALAWLPEVAALARQHNDANVLALPARFIAPEEAKAIVDAFLGADFEGGRHQRRVAGIEAEAVS
jgi:ribose 5-phosphate isomerase B